MQEIYFLCLFTISEKHSDWQRNFIKNYFRNKFYFTSKKFYSIILISKSLDLEKLM